MSVKINCGDYTRSEMIFVDPWQVQVNEELRGRCKAPADEQIVEMALSLRAYGQRQPVECRKMGDNRLLLTLGFTRCAAARLIRTGFTDPETGDFHQDADFRLKVVLAQGNDREAVIRNVVENAHRNQTSPIDDAYNQERLRDTYGLSDAEIAKLYRYNHAGKVGQLQQLLTLAPTVQDLVHTGELAVSSALEVATLPEPQQVATVEKVRAQGKVTAPKVREAIREDILRDSCAPSIAPTAPAPALKPRSMRELRAWLTQDPCTDRQRTFADAMLSYLAGEINDEAMTKALDALEGGR